MSETPLAEFIGAAPSLDAYDPAALALDEQIAAAIEVIRAAQRYPDVARAALDIVAFVLADDGRTFNEYRCFADPAFTVLLRATQVEYAFERPAFIDSMRAIESRLRAKS